MKGDEHLEKKVTHKEIAYLGRPSSHKRDINASFYIS